MREKSKDTSRAQEWDVCQTRVSNPDIVVTGSKQVFPRVIDILWPQLSFQGPILCQRNRARALSNSTLLCHYLPLFSQEGLNKKLDVCAD